MTEHVTKRIKQKRERRERAHLRVRQRVRGNAERPRLSVYKSLQYIYAQVIDDERGVTLAQANSADAEVKGRMAATAGDAAGGGKTQNAAKAVGEVIAERAKAQGIEKVVFDRGGYVFHGKVKAVADGAREKGLQF
jgi:large subunit ribosomal protein L18